jgi:hypothetical protein
VWAGLEGALDVVDGEVLLAHPQDQLAAGVFLGLGMGAMLEFSEEVGFGATEMMAQDAKRGRSVGKAGGDVSRGKTFDVGRRASYWRWAAEVGSGKKRDSDVSLSGELSK